MYRSVKTEQGELCLGIINYRSLITYRAFHIEVKAQNAMYVYSVKHILESVGNH